MGQSRGKEKKAHHEPVGAGGVAWSNPIQVSGLGRSGELTSLEVRGNLVDATTGTMTLMLFEAPIPEPGAFLSSRVVDVLKLNPANIADGDQALRVSGITVAPDSPDDVASSDSVNIRDLTKGTALYAIERRDRALFLAILGVSGRVHTYFRAEGG